MNSKTSILLVVVCIVSVCSLLCAGGITFFVVQNGGVQGALDAITGGGKPGSKWKLTQGSSDCDGTGVMNAGGSCVPLEVDSGDLGSSKNPKYMYSECPEGEYIDTMAAGYNDGGGSELKWLAASCSGGKFWSKGDSAPSKFTGIDNDVGSIGSGTKWDNRYWRDPANPGWDRVAYVSNLQAASGVKAQTNGRVRAFGPGKGSNGRELFGVNDNRSKTPAINEADKKEWRCDTKGTAPNGKRYAIVGIGAATGSAVDRFNVKCRLFDTS